MMRYRLGEYQSEMLEWKKEWEGIIENVPVKKKSFRASKRTKKAKFGVKT